MTREEANQIVAASLDAEKWNSSGLVRALCALGMLKLDEPKKKSVEERLCTAIHMALDMYQGGVRINLGWLTEQLNEAGLKIVEK